MISINPKILLACAFCMLFQAKAQGQEDVLTRLNDYMQTVRTEGATSPVPDTIYRNAQPEAVLNELQPYYGDTVPGVRRKAYYITSRLGRENEEVASIAVQSLVGGLKDNASGIVGSVADYLAKFSTSDFTAEAKDTLSALLKRGTPHYKKLIRLAGFVNPEGGKAYLKNKLRARDYTNASEKWAVMIALARMGDENAIERCLNMVNRMPVGDDFVYEIAPDLVYTRQKKLIEPVIKILHSTEKNCHSRNPESTKNIACGYLIMEYLAPVVKDFPLETDAAGAIAMDDYKKALAITREWFKEHSQYQLVQGTFQMR